MFTFVSIEKASIFCMQWVQYEVKYISGNRAYRFVIVMIVFLQFPVDFLSIVGPGICEIQGRVVWRLTHDVGCLVHLNNHILWGTADGHGT